MSDARTTFIITCEHGGNTVPARYRALFRGQESVLASHRGHDPGALVMARQLARSLGAPLVSSTITRLLVELNRSPGHRQMFSDMTRGLPPEALAAIVARYYQPYRSRVELLVGSAIAAGRRVVHVSSHSFTPALDGVTRNADVGLLYDPRRAPERALCARWKDAVFTLDSTLRVRRNYPYAGKGDGLTKYLRSRFPARRYIGIELEVNQRIALAGGREWLALRGVLVEALRRVCQREKVTEPM